MGLLDSKDSRRRRLRSALEIHTSQNNSLGLMMLSAPLNSTGQRRGMESNFPHIHAALRRGARVGDDVSGLISIETRGSISRGGLSTDSRVSIVIHVERLTKEEKETDSLQSHPARNAVEGIAAID